MPDLAVLDKAFHWTMQRLVKTGQAPHYTELASEMGMSMEEGKQLVHDLIATGIPAWTHPDTDYIVSFPPFNSMPTQYRITVNGQQKWFAQGGFEALAVCWLFPGQVVKIDAPCLDCGESITIEMRDGEVLSAHPDGIFGYTNSEVGGSPETRPTR